MGSLASEIMLKIHGENIWNSASFAEKDAPDDQGWHGQHPALTRLASEPQCRCIIDVGVWKGSSTITLARALKARNADGCVIAVDSFLGSKEHHLDPSFRGLVRWSRGRANLYDIFLNNVMAYGLEDYIVPFPQTTTTAAAILQAIGVAADVIHVDASHNYEDVITDCKAYWPLLAHGGYLIGDDYIPYWPGVIQAAGEFSASLRLPLIIEPPKWILQKS